MSAKTLQEHCLKVCFSVAARLSAFSMQQYCTGKQPIILAESNLAATGLLVLEVALGLL